MDIHDVELHCTQVTSYKRAKNIIYVRFCTNNVGKAKYSILLIVGRRYTLNESYVER